MNPARLTIDPVIIEFRLAADHRGHVTPTLDCPLCFQPALRLGADPRPVVAHTTSTILLTPDPFVAPAA